MKKKDIQQKEIKLWRYRKTLVETERTNEYAERV